MVTSFLRKDEKKIMAFLRILFCYLVIFFALTPHARADMFDDDSCVQGQSIINKLLTNFGLGLFTNISGQFRMDGAGSTPDETKCSPDYYPTNCSGTSCSGDGVMHDSKSCVSCKNSNGQNVSCANSCNISHPTGCTNGYTCASDCDGAGAVKICYKYYNFSPLGLLQEQEDCNWARDGWSKFYFFPMASLRVVKQGDKLCAQTWTMMGFQSIGCKYLPDCSSFAVDSNCYVAEACSYGGYVHSRSLIAMTSMIIECINESLALLFVNTNNCGDSTSYKTNYFPVFQAAMRKAIKAAITLYFVLWGIKLAISGEVLSKGEWFTFVGRYILVIYFSVGILTKYDTNGNPVYSDGVTTIMLPLFKDGATDLSNMVYSSGGVTGLCDYTKVSYESGYQYLSLWDSLDCRILYYLGLDLSRLANVTEAVGVYGILSLLAPPVMLTMLLPALFSFQIIFFIFCVIFVVFVISIMIYFVNILVLATVAIHLLVYMCPIFVPMALFPPTKSYFDGWLKLLISYSLQPMIVAAYMAMMMTIFDNVMFGDCSFQDRSIKLKNVGTYDKEIPYFMLCDPWETSCPGGTNTSLTKCSETIGYQVNPVKSGQSMTQNISALFFNITILKPSVVGNMLSGLITLCLFAYLFYKFAEVLSEFAAEITGGTNLGKLAGNPMAVVDKGVKLVKAAVKAAKAYAKYQMGDMQGAAKDGQEAAKDAKDALSSDEGGKKREGGPGDGPGAPGGEGGGASKDPTGGSGGLDKIMGSLGKK